MKQIKNALNSTTVIKLLIIVAILSMLAGIIAPTPPRAFNSYA